MRRTAVFLALLGAAFLVFLSPVLIKCARMFSHDTLWFYGVFKYFAESLQTGHFPFWDPYDYCGQPFYPNLSIMHLLNPLSVGVIYLNKIIRLPIFTLYHWNIAACIMFSAAGVYFLSRRIFTAFFTSALVTWVFIFSSFTFMCLRQAGFLYAFIWLPWVLCFLIRTTEKVSLYNLIGLAFFMGMAMNGYQGLYVIVFVLFFTLTLFINKRRSLAPFFGWEGVVFLILVAMIVVFISAPLLSVFTDKDDFIPMARLRTSPVQNDSYTNRSGSVPGEPGDLAGFIDRRAAVWGSPGSNQQRSEGLFYIGIIPLLLFLFGLFFGKHPLKLNFAAALVFLIFLYMGERFFMQKAVNFIFPPFGFVRHMQLFAGFIILTVLYFTGLGCDTLLEKIKAMKLKPVFLSVLSLIIMADLFSYGIAALNGSTLPRTQLKFADKPANPVFSSTRERRVVTSEEIRYFKPILYRAPTAFNAGSVPAEFSEQQMKYGLYSVYLTVSESGGRIFNGMADQLTVRDFIQYGMAVFPEWDITAKFIYLDIINAVLVDIMRNRDFYSQFDNYTENALAARALVMSGYQQLSLGSLDWPFKQRMWELLSPILDMKDKPDESAYKMYFNFMGKKYDFLNRIAIHQSLFNRTKTADYLEYLWQLSHIEEFTLIIGKDYEKLISLPSGLQDRNVRRNCIKNLENILGVTENMIRYFPAAEIADMDRTLDSVRGALPDKSTILLSSADKSMKQTESRGGSMAYNVLQYTPNTLSLDVMATGDGYLYYSSAYDKYWSAYVDGIKTDILKAFGAMMAVPITGGRHEVVFDYNPVIFKLSLGIYYLTILVCVSYLVLFRGKK